MSYFDVYRKRLNRFGNDYQSRVQGAREYNFDLYLLKTAYRVDFEFEKCHHAGSLERYKQTDTKTLQYLLTKIDLNIPSGTVLWLTDKDGIKQPWMIYYLENIKASGYNRYIVLKMTHHLTWTDRSGVAREAWAYLYGQEDNMLKDEIRSRSRMDAVYGENLKSSFFITAANPYIKKDDYFIVGEKPLQEYFRVTGYDFQSTEGVEYVTIDPVYEFDLSNAPEQKDDDDESDFFWINGGVNNGNS